MSESKYQTLAHAIGLKDTGKKLAKLVVRNGISTVSQLRKSSLLSKFPKLARLNVLYGINNVELSLSEADKIADDISKRLEFTVANKSVKFPVIAVGSIRRRSPVVRDIDLLVIIPNSVTNTTELLQTARLRGASTTGITRTIDVIASGARRRALVVRVNSGKFVHVDIFVCTERERHFALFHYTGDAMYNIRTRALAKKNGMTLNQYGLFDKAGRRLRVSPATEQGIAKAVGVSFRKPWERTS